MMCILLDSIFKLRFYRLAISTSLCFILYYGDSPFRNPYLVLPFPRYMLYDTVLRTRQTCPRNLLLKTYIPAYQRIYLHRPTMPIIHAAVEFMYIHSRPFVASACIYTYINICGYMYASHYTNASQPQMGQTIHSAQV